MAVEKDFRRDAIALTWDAEKVGAPDDRVDLVCVSDNDESERLDLINDGRATVTVPSNAHGEFKATVTGPKGTDEGVIRY